MPLIETGCKGEGRKTDFEVKMIKTERRERQSHNHFSRLRKGEVGGQI